MALRPPGADSQAQFAKERGPCSFELPWACFCAFAILIPPPLFIPQPPILCQAAAELLPIPLAAGCYNAFMTLVEITYELQSPLTEEQLRQLGQFANTYALPPFPLTDSTNQFPSHYHPPTLR